MLKYYLNSFVSEVSTQEICSIFMITVDNLFFVARNTTILYVLLCSKD